MNNLTSFIFYLHFSALVIALLAIVDFMIRFKRPLNFKICYSLLLVSLFILNIAFWLKMPFTEITRFSPLINFGIWGMGLYSLSILNNGKIEKWVWITSGLILALNIYNFFFLQQHLEDYQDKQGVFSLRLSEGFTTMSVARIAQRLIMLVALFKLILTIRKNENQHNIYQRKLTRWLAFVLSFVAVSILLNNVFSFFFSNDPHKSDYLLITYNIFCLSISLLTIYRPTFLNNQVLGNLNLKKLSLSEGLKLTDANFYNPFFNQFYYLQKDATIENFCVQNQIEEREVFNEQIISLYNMSFSNLINQKRVEYFVNLAKDSKYKNYSIEALALESGFSSRTALYKPFKKYHGGTPIEFLNSINN